MDKREMFIKKFQEAGGELVESLEDLKSKVMDFKGFVVEEPLKKRYEDFFSQFHYISVFDAEVSFTEAAAASADTGSLIFAFSSGDTHLLTSLPKIHVVFLKSRLIFETLEEALDRFKDFSYISVITGPSKTGDIELIHVAGVHGPERLLLFLED